MGKMKQFNIKKLIKHSLLWVCICGNLLFTGCPNISTPEKIPDDNGANTKPSVGKITVSLELGDLLPVTESFSSDAARSAMPSTFDGTEYVFAGAVHDSSTTVTKDMLKIAGSVTPDAAKEKLTIEMPFEISTSDRNDWTLSLYAFKSGTTSISDSDFASPIFYGTTTITIPANAITPSSVGSVKLVPKTLPSDINGKIGLKIAVPKGYTLSAECNTSGHSVSSCGFAFTKDTELSGASTTSDFYTFTESDTSAGIASGEHDVAFTVQKPMETSPETYTPVYLWGETITVYPYLTTGRWTSGNVDANGIRVITESQFFSTFFVSGTSHSLLTVAGDDTNGDGSLAKPFATVQKAVDKVIAMNNGAEYTIYVDGTFKAATNQPLIDFKNLAADKKLKVAIIGNGTSRATLDGNHDNGNTSEPRRSVIMLDTSGSNPSQGGTTKTIDLTLKNLFITKGYGEFGGGINFNGKTLDDKLVLDNCILSGNTATYGAGMMVLGGTVILKNGTEIGDTSKNELATSSGCGNYASNNGGGITLYNSAQIKCVIESGCKVYRNYCAGSSGDEGGGGIMVQSGAKLEIQSGACVQYNYMGGDSDKAGKGGGIYVDSATDKCEVIIEGDVSKNGAKYKGGGIYIKKKDGSNSAGIVTINDGAVISGNEAENGGAIYNDDGGTVKITGGTISGNTATSNGKAIYNNGTLEMSGSTQIESAGSDANDVYLSSSSDRITITGSLTPLDSTKPVATITPSSYTSGTVVLQANDAALITDNYSKFTLSDASAYSICPDSATPTQAILAKPLITIATAADFTTKLNSNPNANIKLAADIAISGNSTLCTTTPFNGTIDGNGHTITISADNQFADANSGDFAVCIFGKIGSNGVIKNLTVSSSDIAVGSGAAFGGICKDNDGTIENCTNSINFSSSASTRDVGGICINNNGTIKNCTNNGNLALTTGTVYSNCPNVGGIAATNKGTIENCTNNGTLVCNKNLGPIVGRMDSGTVTGCTDTKEITVNGSGR